MPRERDYIDLEGRSASDIFDQIRERRTEFPGRDYKLAFDVQEMKGGGFRATVRYWVDVTAEKRLNSVTPRDDFRNVVRSGQSITYFASQAQREAFDAAIEHDEFALEERLTTIKDLDWGKSTVLDALKESTLPGVAADYGVSNEELLQRSGINLLDLGLALGYPSVKSRKIPMGLAADLGVEHAYLRKLRVEDKII